MKNGWQKQKLRDVCELVNGRAYRKSELLDKGKYRVLRVGNFFTNKQWYYSDLELDEKKYCDTGDLLYAWSASFGPRIWAGEKVIFHYHIWKVIPDLALIDQKFLFHFFLWDTERIKEDQGTGTTMIHVSKGSMEDRDIQLPPLPEQQRIVGILDEAFAGIATAKANAERNLQNARALFESVLASAIIGELTKEWREKSPKDEAASDLLRLILAKRRENWNKKGKYTEPTTPSTVGLPPIPDTWTWTNLDQLKSLSLYGPRFSKDDYTDSGVLVLRTSDINEQGKVNSQTAPKLAMTAEDFEKYKCKKGDLLITRTGSLGTLAVFNDDTHAIPGAYLIQYRLVIPEIMPRYLFMFFKSPTGQSRLTDGATGSGRPNLNVPTIEEIQIPFPPLAEQQAIINKLDNIWDRTQRLESIYQQKLAALDELKKSLLHQAFTGQLQERAMNEAETRAVTIHTRSLAAPASLWASSSRSKSIST